MKKAIRVLVVIGLIGISIAGSPISVSSIGAANIKGVATGQLLAGNMHVSPESQNSFQGISSFMLFGSGFTWLIVWRRKKRFE